MTVYEKILYHAATKNIVPKVALTVFSHSISPVYRAISRGIKRDFLEEKTIQIKLGKVKYKEDCILITTKGLDYLCSLNQPEIKWLSPVDEDTSIMSSSLFSVDKMHRYISMTANAIIAEEIGIAVSPMFFESNSYSGKKILKDFIMKDYENKVEKEREMQKQSVLADVRPEVVLVENPSAQEDSTHDTFSVSFCTALDVKKEMGLDEARGRYTGVFRSASSIVISYVLLKGTFSFTDDESIQNRRLYNHMLRSNEVEVKPLARSSVLMINSPREFKKSFFEEHKSKREVLASRIMFSGIQEFCVFPISLNGITSLRSYLLDEDFEKEIYDVAIESGRFERNDRKYSEVLFPIISSDEVPTMIGVKMDLIKIFSMESVADKNPDQTFGVICYDWQVEYYEQMDIELRITSINTSN